METIVAKPSDFFQGPDAVERFENLKQNLARKAAEVDALAREGQIVFEKKAGSRLIGKAAQVAEMVKAGVSPDIVKEWSSTAPVSNSPIANASLTPYDYEQEVLSLVPNDTPIRNTVARTKGEGQGFEYRRITGVSNSRTAGAANVSPFFVSEGTANTQYGVNLNRAPLMSEVGDKFFAPYIEMGLQSQVSMKYQFAGQGFADIRALSHLYLLRSGWFAEENALLNSSATALNITGASYTAAADSGTTGTGLPALTSAPVTVTFSNAWGESQAISAGTVTITAGQGIKATTPTIPAGTVAVNTYVNNSGTYYKGTTVLTTGASPKTFSTVTALPSTTADNGSVGNYQFGGTLIANASSGSVVSYNGMVSEFLASGGYVSSLNGTLSTASPFVELETAFASLAQSNAARPDLVITTYSIRTALWDLLKSGNSGATNYRVNLETGENGIISGGAVASVVNPATGDTVAIQGHRFASPGLMIIHSTRVPWQDSNIGATVQVRSVVDNMVLDFPQVGMSYDAQTYSYGTAVFQAPVLSGIITNINN